MPLRRRACIIFWVALCVWIVSPAPVRAANADRDFSGSWNLNTAESQIRALPTPPATLLEIEQDDSLMRIVSRDNPAAPVSWSYSVTGKTTKHKVGESSYSSATKWEGTALLVNTIVSGAPGSYTRMERWRLSGDGRTLSIRTQIVRPSGETESTLVYRRAGAPSVEPELITRGEPVPSAAPAPKPEAAERAYTVPMGSRVPLRLLSTVSSKSSAEGDRVYLTSVFPVSGGGRIVIPPGSYVAATVTEVTRPGRVKGRGGFFLRFDSLTLTNGVTRDLRSRPSGADADQGVTLDKNEGELKGSTNKGGDARTVGQTTAAGASVGAIAGAVGGRYGMGVGIGAAAGAAAGLAGVLLSRGPDAVLRQGATVEMTLDRELTFNETELGPGPVR